MSRLVRPLPFDPPACECRPGYTLCWLCGVTEELAPRHRANGSKPLAHQRQASPTDRRSTAKGKNSEVRAR